MRVLNVAFDSEQAPSQFTDSFRDTGFAVISNHPINMDLVRGVYQEWEAFFASPAKNDYIFDTHKQDGYFPYLSENAKGYAAKDLKEFYHVYPWGRIPAGMSGKTRQLYQEMSSLAATLLAWVHAHTPASVARGFSMPLEDMITDSQQTLLRVLHYPPLQGDEAPQAVRAAAHEDINLITLLPAATAPGLQVLDRFGSWHDVECNPGTIVVNVGDMLQMCSGGYYPSTTHRVINPMGDDARKSRFSMPLFLHPRADVRLSAEYTASGYLLERLREIGLK